MFSYTASLDPHQSHVKWWYCCTVRNENLKMLLLSLGDCFTGFFEDYGSY